jgi:hypothetical protein
MERKKISKDRCLDSWLEAKMRQTKQLRLDSSGKQEEKGSKSDGGSQSMFRNIFL